MDSGEKLSSLSVWCALAACRDPGRRQQSSSSKQHGDTSPAALKLWVLEIDGFR
jgi:hypothetical protein